MFSVRTLCLFQHLQEAEEDLEAMAKMEKDVKKEEEKPLPKPANKKRKAGPDPDLSTPRPRRLDYDVEGSEDDNEQGSEAPHVPTPTSSAYGDSDDEDKDLFRDKYRGQSSGSKKPEVQKPAQLETPPTTKATTPASHASGSRFSCFADEVQDMLAGIEDELLATIPTALSRLVVGCTHVVVTCDGFPVLSVTTSDTCSPFCTLKTSSRTRMPWTSLVLMNAPGI